MMPTTTCSMWWSQVDNPMLAIPVYCISFNSDGSAEILVAAAFRVGIQARAVSIGRKKGRPAKGGPWFGFQF